MTRSVLLVLTLSSSLALAQESEEDSETSYPCPLAGLKDGKVTVTEEGGVALFNGKKRLATLQIPEFDFNASKGEVTCKGEKISIHSQMPFKATTRSVDVTWKGGKLQAGTPEVEDPSFVSLEAAEKALKEGRIEEAITHLSDVAYPHNYYSAHDMAVRILRRAHEVSRQRYKARDAAGAAETLGMALEHATDNVSPSEEREGLPAEELTALRNDYGFFLAEAGRSAEAEKVLREVVASAPERAVARLNLGDSLWAQGKKQEAEEQYLEYAKRIPRRKWPATLAERCPSCASLK
jgi:tetratricopeptide (TPR) repeat protein